LVDVNTGSEPQIPKPEPRIPARQPWSRLDLAFLGSLAAIAAIAVALGFAGASRIQPIAGLALILALAYCLSSARRSIDYRTVAWGLGLQFVFALIVLKTDIGRAVFQSAGNIITRLLNFSIVGSDFVFGPLGNPDVWRRMVTTVLGAEGDRYLNLFAFMVLPTIIFIAALFAMLYYFGIMQFIVRLFAVIMRRFMRASGAESLNVAASIFMGQTEAPLTIRPFLPRMTESELMTVMTAGMAHISGGVMAAYILFGVEAQHLLTAVIMTAPGTLMMAKIFVPETGQPETMGTVRLEVEKTDVNVIDAVGRGTGEGLHLALNVGAMLISFLALVALLNAGLGVVGEGLQRTVGVGAGLSLQLILGYVFAPIAWALGVPWQDAPTIGNLLGTRMVLNEFVAYSQLGPLKASLDPKSFTIATFALCGFANFSSVGIQIGGIGALAPERRHDLARLGLRAMLAGTFANFLTATIAGMLL
jgi:concentrative nucleoside transporter, CNT family